MANKFNSPKAASEWNRLVNDLLASATAGGNQSTTVESLRDRFGRLEIGINVAPAKLINDQMKQMAASLDKRLSSLSDGDDTAARKSLRDDLKALERSIVKQALTSQSKLGKELLQSQARRDRDSRRKFVKDTHANSAELKLTLGKQLLEVTQSRGLSDSEGLRRLEADMASALQALQREDYAQFRQLDAELRSIDKYEVGSDLTNRLESVGDLVREQAERKASRHQSIERGFGRVGLGGAYRGARSVSRGVSSVYRGLRSAKNFVVRANSSLSRKGRSVSSVQARVSSPESVREEARDNEDSGLLRRQVRALEGLFQSSKRGSAPGGGTGASSGSGFGLGSFAGFGKKAGSLLGGLGSGGAKTLLGRLGAVGLAAMAGWEAGSFIYKAYSKEIDKALETVIGVVMKSVEFLKSGVEWFGEFLKDPLDKVRQIGGNLKSLWDNSVFAKLFSSPGQAMQDAAAAVIKSVSNVSQVAGGKLAAVASSLAGPNLGGGSSFNFSNDRVLGRIFPKLNPVDPALMGESQVGSSSASLIGRTMASATVSGGSSSSTPGHTPTENQTEVSRYTPMAPQSGPMRVPAVPIQERVPQAVETQSRPSNDSDFGSMNVPAPQPTGPVSRGSVSSIPTFSYVDAGFFLMNAGVI